jgi:aspartate carbamoyltransferase
MLKNLAQKAQSENSNFVSARFARWKLRKEFGNTDPDKMVYLVFSQSSLRTKESFRNAGKLAGFSVQDLDVSNARFGIGETYTEALKMLMQYSLSQTIFVVRSELEGLQRWLDVALKKHAKELGLQTPSVINAGDGHHEHPTQELIDQFTFLEQRDFDRSFIHIALVGDLLNSRTMHSKVEGLAIFDAVHVDLVAPNALQMPPHYVDRMSKNGWKIRIFTSIDEYLDETAFFNSSLSSELNGVAPMWYYVLNRVQIQNLSELTRERPFDDLAYTVSFREDLKERLPIGTKFYHPLPRDREFPEIPFTFDGTPLNGYHRQAQNGYYIRTVLLSMLSGQCGWDFKAEMSRQSDRHDERALSNATTYTCTNEECVSHPVNYQREVMNKFDIDPHTKLCRYCGRPAALPP